MNPERFCPSEETFLARRIYKEVCESYFEDVCVNARFQKQRGQSGPEVKGWLSVKVCGQRFGERPLGEKDICGA